MPFLASERLCRFSPALQCRGFLRGRCRIVRWMNRGDGAEFAAEFVEAAGENGDDAVALFVGDDEGWTELGGGVAAVVVAEDETTVSHLVGEPVEEFGP